MGDAAFADEGFTKSTSEIRAWEKFYLPIYSIRLRRPPCNHKILIFPFLFRLLSGMPLPVPFACGSWRSGEQTVSTICQERIFSF